MRSTQQRVQVHGRPTALLAHPQSVVFWLGATLIALHGTAALAAFQAGLPEIPLVAATTIDGSRSGLAPVDVIAVAQNGLVAVTQGQDFNVRLFGADGAPLASAGRRGSGPGEFLNVSTVGWTKDSLWTWDPHLRRLTLFKTDGKVARSLTIVAFIRSIGTVRENVPGRILAVYPDGRLLVDGIARRSESSGEGSPRDRVALIARDSGRVQQILTTVPADPSILVVQSDRGMGEISVPFVTRPLLTASPDGQRVAVVWIEPSDASPRIHARVVGQDGRVVFTRTYPFEKVTIGKEVIDSAVNARLRRLTDPELRRTVSKGLRERVPGHFPAFVSALLATDGRLWIELRSIGRQRPWLVISARGEPEFRTSVPRDVSLRVALADGVWGVREQASGDLAVVLYRLRASTGREKPEHVRRGSTKAAGR